MKALRQNTSRLTPVSISPAFAPVTPSTGTLLSVYVAENSRIGAPFAFVVRVTVMSKPSQVSSMLPSIGAPDQGA